MTMSYSARSLFARKIDLIYLAPMGASVAAKVIAKNPISWGPVAIIGAAVVVGAGVGLLVCTILDRSLPTGAYIISGTRDIE